MGGFFEIEAMRCDVRHLLRELLLPLDKVSLNKASKLRVEFRLQRHCIPYIDLQALRVPYCCLAAIIFWMDHRARDKIFSMMAPS